MSFPRFVRRHSRYSRLSTHCEHTEPGVAEKGMFCFLNEFLSFTQLEKSAQPERL